MYQPAKGEIRYSGLPVNNNLVEYQRQLCFVGHKTGINPYLTVSENCLFDMHYESRDNDVTELTSIFKLEHHMDHPCGLLSAGQRRQVGLLRLWMCDLSLWLLDEPFVALDERALLIVMKKIGNHRSQGGIVLLTSHQNLPLKRADYQEYNL